MLRFFLRICLASIVEGWKVVIMGRTCVDTGALVVRKEARARLNRAQE